jgi:hypothetical protein
VPQPKDESFGRTRDADSSLERLLGECSRSDASTRRVVRSDAPVMTRSSGGGAPMGKTRTGAIGSIVPSVGTTIEIMVPKTTASATGSRSASKPRSWHYSTLLSIIDNVKWL